MNTLTLRQLREFVAENPDLPDHLPITGTIEQRIPARLVTLLRGSVEGNAYVHFNVEEEEEG